MRRRMAKTPVRASTPEMGPAILASGYLTKRTRAMGRWKKRWWQLTDNGTLLYFKSEERAKALGEIDAARSCYDVRLGAERCKVHFPSAVPSCCCFSFSLLKRTYYLYASNAAEAKNWAEALRSVSLVMNYGSQIQGSSRPLQMRPAPAPPSGDGRRRRAQSAAAMVVRRGAPGAKRGAKSVTEREKRYSLPVANPQFTSNSHSSGGTSISMQPSSVHAEEDDKPTDLPKLCRARPARYTISGNSSRFGSVPDLQMGGYYNPTDRTNSRLWLDGSPQPFSRGMVRRPDQMQRGAGLRGSWSSLSQPLSSSYSENLHSAHLGEHSISSHPPNRQVPQPRQDSTFPRSSYAVGNRNGQVQVLPPRPQSADLPLMYGKRTRFSLQHEPMQPPSISEFPFLSQESALPYPTDPSFLQHKNPPPPVKPKPILKKTKPQQTTQSEVITTIPTLFRPTPPEIPPKPPSVKVSVDHISGQRDIFLPPPPNFKPPPPPEAGSDQSVSPHSSELESEGGRSDTYSPTSSRSSLKRASWSMAGHHFSQPVSQHDADTWAWHQLHTLSKEIKRLGMSQPDGSVCITLGALLSRAESSAEHLLAGLATAKKLQIVNYDGDRDKLIRGRDEAKLITLIRNVR